MMLMMMMIMLMIMMLMMMMMIVMMMMMRRTSSLRVRAKPRHLPCIYIYILRKELASLHQTFIKVYPLYTLHHWWLISGLFMFVCLVKPSAMCNLLKFQYLPVKNLFHPAFSHVYSVATLY
jgi:hypothetical protein